MPSDSAAATLARRGWLLEAGRDGHGHEGAAAADARSTTALADEHRARSSRSSATGRVDGREIQGWLIRAGAGRASRSCSRSTAARTRSTAGRRCWEFQVLAAAGIGVCYCNPRGSEGYGEAFNDANHRDWGPGPMRDVLAGVDALVADGLRRPGPARRDRRLVRRLPDQLDRRPRPSGSGRRSPAARSAT